MKKLFFITLITSLASLATAQEAPPYDRTRENIVEADRATWSRYFMGTPHGTSPVFPAYTPDSLKAGSLYFQKSDSTLQVYNGAAWAAIGQLTFAEGLTKTGHYVGLGGSLTHDAVLNGSINWTTSNNAWLTFSPVLNELDDSLANTAIVIDPTFSDHSHIGDKDWALKILHGQSYFAFSAFFGATVAGNVFKANQGSIPVHSDISFIDTLNRATFRLYSDFDGAYFGSAPPSTLGSKKVQVDEHFQLTGLVTGTATSGLGVDGSGNVMTYSLSGGGGTPGGSNTDVQLNASGAFAGSSNFTVSGGMLYFKGSNYATMAINAATYPSLAFQSNGTSYATLGGGNSSLFSGATDFSLIGSANVSIEAPNIYLVGALHLPNAATFGSSTASNITYNVFGSGASGSSGINFDWNNGAAVASIGNVDGIAFPVNNTGDLALYASKNIAFLTSATDQTGLAMQIMKATGSVIIQRGGTFTDDPNLNFQVNSTTQGTAFAGSMTTTQKTAISSPSERETVYDSTLHLYQYWNGTAWTTL